MNVGDLRAPGRIDEHHAAQAPAAPAGQAEAPPLGIGASGSEVAALQNKMLQAGVKLGFGADGRFGPATASALAGFQRQSGLPPTGTVDGPTLEALEKAAKKQPAQAPAAASAPGGASSAIPRERLVTGFKLADDAQYGGGRLFATIGGRPVLLADDAMKAKSFGDGRYLAWSSPKGAGGYENEGQGLTVYDAATGKTSQVLAEYYPIQDMAYHKLPDGREALLVSMVDGGLGAPHTAVVDPARGEVGRFERAHVETAKGGALTLSLHADDGDPDVKTGAKTVDLGKLLGGKVIVNKRDDPL